MPEPECPYKVGDYVIYRPSLQGYAYPPRLPDGTEMVKDQKYRIAKIVKNYYIVCEGFEAASGGGLFWTEFEK